MTKIKFNINKNLYYYSRLAREHDNMNSNSAIFIKSHVLLCHKVWTSSFRSSLSNSSRRFPAAIFYWSTCVLYHIVLFLRKPSKNFRGKFKIVILPNLLKKLAPLGFKAVVFCSWYQIYLFFFLQKQVSYSCV